MAIRWCRRQSSTRLSSRVGPPSAQCRTWWASQRRALQPGNRHCRSRDSSARRSAGGTVRVFRPTSRTEPSVACCITTAPASHAMRRAVSGDTRSPSASSSAACPAMAARDAPSRSVSAETSAASVRCSSEEALARPPAPAGRVSAETSAASARSDSGSTCSTTWYRSPAVPRSGSDDRALSASSPSASACRWPKLVSAASAAETSVRNRSAAASSARRTTAPTSGDSRPRITTIPSSSTQVFRFRRSCRRRSSAASACRSTRADARARRSMDAGAVVSAVGAMAGADMSMTVASLPTVAVVGSSPQRTGQLCSDATLMDLL